MTRRRFRRRPYIIAPSPTLPPCLVYPIPIVRHCEGWEWPGRVGVSPPRPHCTTEGSTQKGQSMAIHHRTCSSDVRFSAFPTRP
ncbi:hypothetical protein B005_2935 [Nocardiopsis alba ATCC BAA-2165]|uniref:Uncharacterized protein n=1 Tax=Nocardiopsis alba (strain ATCC BAA-2165 / BE74) TaxID=1205910 RepID=J7LGA5_NOCAA|nr:hypothetical protein B005_2935 [Nocardiopsis alba ATCC BAA-2165]